MDFIVALLVVLTLLSYCWRSLSTLSCAGAVSVDLLALIACGALFLIDTQSLSRSCCLLLSALLPPCESTARALLLLSHVLC